MSRTVTPRKKKAQPEIGLEIMMREYLNALLVQNYSVNTIENREFLILQFIQWCIERGLCSNVINGICSSIARRTASR
jgi:hypothetical protein